MRWEVAKDRVSPRVANVPQVRGSEPQRMRTWWCSPQVVWNVWERTAQAMDQAHPYTDRIAPNGLEEIAMTIRSSRSPTHVENNRSLEKAHVPLSVWLGGTVLVVNVSSVVLSLMA